MMKLGLVFLTLLYFATWTGIVHSANGPVAACCLRVSQRKADLNTIVDYRNQSDTICGIAAVVFTKKVGDNVGRICADPNRNWTKRAVQKVNADRLAALQGNQGQAGGAN